MNSIGYKEVVLAAVQQYDYNRENNGHTFAAHGHVLKFVHPDLAKDKEIALAAVTKNSRALKYIHEDLQKDPDILAVI